MRNACLHTYYKFTSYYYIFKFENEWNIGIHACLNILYTYTIIHIYCVYYLYKVKKYVIVYYIVYRMCIYIYASQIITSFYVWHPSIPLYPHPPHPCSPYPSFSSASLACATPWGRRNTRRFQLLWPGAKLGKTLQCWRGWIKDGGPYLHVWSPPRLFDMCVSYEHEKFRNHGTVPTSQLM